MGSLKRSAEGERNRGNTVRKGEVAFLCAFIVFCSIFELVFSLHLVLFIYYIKKNKNFDDIRLTSVLIVGKI